MLINFTGRTALVTGGAGGIGGAVARALADSGAKVIATGLDAAELARASEDPRLVGIALASLNVADDAAVQGLAADVGDIDILVNCAGTTSRGDAAFEEAAFNFILDVNLSGTMRCCRAFRAGLAARGGNIINIASVMSFLGSGTAPGYAASKGGVALLTKSLAIAWARDGVRVNAIAPGFIITPLTDAQIDPAYRARVEARTPMGRWGQPDHIADAAVFLASERASFITGAIVPVDGGYLAA